jgi:hypothetical protein
LGKFNPQPTGREGPLRHSRVGRRRARRREAALQARRSRRDERLTPHGQSWRARRSRGLSILGLSLLTAAVGGSARAQAPAKPAPAKPATGIRVEEVVVTGQRAAAETLIDRKVYTVTSDLQASPRRSAGCCLREPD